MVKFVVAASTLIGVLIVTTILILSITYLLTRKHKICQSDPCIIKLPEGHVKGIESTTVLNKKSFVVFKGIPYAEPPVGHLRFKDPIPMKSWSKVIDGADANVCPQLDQFTGQYNGNEDCLFINVYTPQLPSQGYPNLLAVMVWIHGGGFRQGGGDDEYLGPDFLIEHDIVLVTFNYRLNVLGFLSLGNKEVPGNAGLKDQNLALKWVQNNIEYFSGNKEKVTLFGESAGAAAVHYHTLIPQSSGLFHRVIMQSGTVLNPWAFSRDPVPCAISLGNALGFKTTSIDELYNFLKEQPPEVLIEYEKNVVCNEKKKRNMPFLPSKEVAGTGSNFLIIEDPENLQESRQFSHVPYLIGMTDKEGLFLLTEEMQTSPDILKTISSNYSYFLPEDLDDDSPASEAIALKIRQFYLENQTLTWETISKYVDYLTDLHFMIGIDKLLYYLNKNSDEPPVYVYTFSFYGNLSHVRNQLKKKVKDYPPGAAHADELGYMFYNKENKKFVTNKNTADINAVNIICTLWTNFAKYGDPNEKGFGVVWNKYMEHNQQYLDIGKTLKVVHSYLYENRSTFWYDMYQLLP